MLIIERSGAVTDNNSSLLEGEIIPHMDSRCEFIGGD
jgi:hypothetical protein